MPVTGVQVERITREGVYGRVAPGARVTLENLSASPYGPLGQRRLHVVHANPGGDFFCPVPVAREGDRVRLVVGDQVSRGAAVRQLLTLRGLAARDERRPEVEVQGLRLVRGADGLARFVNVRRNPAVGEPGVTLRLTNQRTGAQHDLVLDDDGRIPAGAALAAEPGDLFVVAATDGVHNARLGERWSSLCVTDPTQPVDEPSLCLGDRGPSRGTRLASASGPLVKGGIDGDDPLQGAVGDCWLVAAVSAIARMCPERLTEIIRPAGDGRYAVTFKAWDEATGCYVDHVETVTARLPRIAGADFAYGRARDGKRPDTAELWWPLIEKAYAQWKGSYDAIDCGYPYAAFEALLGREGEHLDLDELDADALFAALGRAEAERAPVVLCSRPESDWPRSDRRGLVKDHAYTLLGVYEEGGERWVRLRNPWGEGEPTGGARSDRKDDGVFELRLDDLRAYFCWASVAR